jgi:DNA-directed RNA polymerase subunit RPC12/RpoP
MPLLAKIPALWFFGVEIPRIFVLGCAVMWFFGGVKLIADGLGEAIFVRAFVAELRAGKGVDELLAEDVRTASWSNEMCKLAAQAVSSGQPYAAAVRAIARRTCHTIDEVVLTYRLTVDFIAERSALLRRAARKTGAKWTLDDYAFPAVRVTESQKRSFGDLLTKVELSAKGNATPLLTQGDLIYSYDGQLIWEAEQLERLAAAKDSRESAGRGAPTREDHEPPSAHGRRNEYAWQALTFEVAGGPVHAGIETQGSQPEALISPTPSAGAEGPEYDVLRFVCPGCGKRLKSSAAAAGKKIRCPNCQSPVCVPTSGE